MNQSKLSAERARELFAYDPETGSLTWVGKKGVKPGSPAGCVDTGGYLRVKVDLSHYAAHRIAWLLHTGEWPEALLDHKNGCRVDNRISNLRLATRTTNAENQRHPHTGSATGVLGVCPHRGRFRAVISVRGAQKHIGLFDTPEEAHQAYLTAKRQLHAGCTI